eukprot:s4767_g1.t4
MEPAASRVEAGAETQCADRQIRSKGSSVVGQGGQKEPLFPRHVAVAGCHSECGCQTGPDPRTRRVSPRSLLKAMDSPIASVVRSHLSKRMVLMQLALLPMSFARAKARATSARSPLLKARTHRGGTTQAGASTRRLDVASDLVKEKLQVAANAAEEEILQAWKKLVLLLHPEKLQRLDDESKKEGADALHEVHEAKDEMRRYLRSQRLELLLAALMQHPGRESMKSAGRCLMPR